MSSEVGSASASVVVTTGATVMVVVGTVVVTTGVVVVVVTVVDVVCGADGSLLAPQPVSSSMLANVVTALRTWSPNRLVSGAACTSSAAIGRSNTDTEYRPRFRRQRVGFSPP
ncbi:hypothetical protein GCM10027047_00740 [Rhodococcus aerolatus]